jgi:predicted acyl esterase
MVQVQSTWFPLADRNPQTFCDICAAKDTDFQRTTHRVYHGPAMPSGVTVRVVK